MNKCVHGHEEGECFTCDLENYDEWVAKRRLAERRRESKEAWEAFFYSVAILLFMWALFTGIIGLVLWALLPVPFKLATAMWVACSPAAVCTYIVAQAPGRWRG